jgi:hypothetical protein
LTILSNESNRVGALPFNLNTEASQYPKRFIKADNDNMKRKCSHTKILHVFHVSSFQNIQKHTNRGLRVKFLGKWFCDEWKEITDRHVKGSIANSGGWRSIAVNHYYY